MTSTWGNHSSSTPHTQSIAHSNSITDTGYTARSHSLSFGSTSYTTVPDRLEGSLSVLRKAAAEARASLDSKNTVVDIPDGVIKASQVAMLLSNSGGSVGPYYNWGTFSMNLHGNHAVSGGHSSHASSGSLSNTKLSKIASWSGHSNTAGGSAHGNTSGTDFQGEVAAKVTRPESSYAVETGTKALRSQALAILAILNKGKATSTLPTFGNWSITGTNKHYYSVDHSQWGNHSN